MLDNEKAPQPKLEGGTHDQHEHLNTSTFDGEAAKKAIQDEFAPLVQEMRESVLGWKERIDVWRGKAGPDAEMQIQFYKYHPAYPDLCTLLSNLFLLAEDDEVQAWAVDTLSKITMNTDGEILYAGKCERGFEGFIDTMARAADVAIKSGDLAGAGLAHMQVELGQSIKAILWADDWPAEIPLVVGIREALR